MKKYDVLILGAGIAGLSAAHALSRAGIKLAVCESDAAVGGLSKTIVRGEFRFDLGGHRFFTKNKQLEEFVRQLMGEEFVVAPRKSKIYLRGRYFDYPLKPANALFGLGIRTAVKIIADYATVRLKNLFVKPNVVSLEDWVVNNFGREMFRLYFREYSEKVWGIECNKMSEEWVAQRIKGLSLSVAIRNAFFKSQQPVATLIERFLYPKLGIGRISERLQEEIRKSGEIFLNARVTRINHNDARIESAVVSSGDGNKTFYARDFISSIPLPNLIRMLNPAPPEEIIQAAQELRYRDTIIVALMVNRDRITDLTWIYVPERSIPFGRVHEPKNWSEHMAPRGRSVLVAEYFCFNGDEIWSKSDEELARITVENVEKLGFLKASEVFDSAVVRVKNAYPLLEVNYRKNYEKLLAYLDRFENLQLVGRTGMFRYHNIDHAMETGIKAAENLLGKLHDLSETNESRDYLEEIYARERA